MNSAVPYAQLLAGLGTLLLQRQADRAFTIPGAAPDWFISLAPERAAEGGPFDPGGIFPFLDHFLDDAEEYWAAGDGKMLRSGIWSETLQGIDWHFEALVCTEGTANYLLIQRLTAHYDQLRQVFQKGRELSLVHEQLEAEISKKEILLHCIIHDMSAPLQGMTSSLEIVRGKVQDPAAKRMVELGLLSAKEQANLIHDLLDTFRSEISANDAVLTGPDSAPDALACVREAITLFQPTLSVRGLKGEIQAPEGAAALPVVAEKSRLDRIFYNLLQNAIRHSPPGGAITISVREEGRFVRIAVEDRGPGVPPEVIPQLFQKFVRHGRTRGRAGLGLFFCRIAVEQWGGSVGCQPREGGGSVFWLRLRGA